MKLSFFSTFLKVVAKQDFEMGGFSVIFGAPTIFWNSKSDYFGNQFAVSKALKMNL